MENTPLRPWLRSGGLAILALAAAALAVAQGKPEVYDATASAKTVAGTSVTSPVVLSITRWTTDAERDSAQAALKSGGSAAFQKAIAGMPEIGTIQVGAIKKPLRYARSLPVGDGKVISAVTAKPLYYLGAGAADAKPKAGYDMAVAIFQVDAAGKGTFGDFAPAAKVKMDEKGTIVIEDYGTEPVALSKISKK